MIFSLSITFLANKSRKTLVQADTKIVLYIQKKKILEK